MEKKRGRPRKRTHPTKEDLILQYEHTPLPVFFVNQKLEVFHANIYAYENYHAMTLADGLWSVLPEGASGECIRHLQAGEDFRVDLPLLKATRAQQRPSGVGAEGGGGRKAHPLRKAPGPERGGGPGDV